MGGYKIRPYNFGFSQKINETIIIPNSAFLIPNYFFVIFVP